jgi:hypothetical protein
MIVESDCRNCDSGTYLTGLGISSSYSCSLCAAGKYQSGMGTTSCSICSKGKYQTGSGMVNASDCILCGVGFYQWSTGTTFCIECRPGQYQLGVGSDGCLSCEAGKYQLIAGSDICLLCDAGKYRWDVESVDCLLCTPGKYQPGVGKSVNCLLCTPGKYQSGAGMTVCLLCDAGKYQSGAGMTVCLLCDAGKYQSGAGMTVCLLCDAGKYQTGMGEMDSSKCCKSFQREVRDFWSGSSVTLTKTDENCECELKLLSNRSGVVACYGYRCASDSYCQRIKEDLSTSCKQMTFGLYKDDPDEKECLAYCSLETCWLNVDIVILAFQFSFEALAIPNPGFTNQQIWTFGTCGLPFYFIIAFMHPQYTFYPLINMAFSVAKRYPGPRYFCDTHNRACKKLVHISVMTLANLPFDVIEIWQAHQLEPENPRPVIMKMLSLLANILFLVAEWAEVVPLMIESDQSTGATAMAAISSAADLLLFFFEGYQLTVLLKQYWARPQESAARTNAHSV